MHQIRHNFIRKVGAIALLSCCFFGANSALGIGTDAGVNIANTATVNFAVGGNAQTPVNSNTVQTVVDELIDVVVVDDNSGSVGVSVGEVAALLQFSVTNNGNGDEVFRIIADDTVVEGGFNPSLNQLYLESNGLAGLQIGGDTPYVSGSGDPVLSEDETLVVYVTADIPGGLSQGDNGDVELRAIAQTIITQAGVDDPNLPAWPTPGTSYAGAGDGGGAAVVGSSNDINNLLVRTAGRYTVSDAVVAINKSASAVVDPFGGTILVPGTVITYQIDVTVTGSGTADSLVITDPIPAELQYQTGTLRIGGVPEDDDFAPAGTDVSGFDAPNATISIDRGSVVGGSAPIVITFDAVIR